MARTIKADGDRWRVKLGEDRPHPGVRVVLFFCETTDQRPYRVVEVPEGRFSSQSDLERLSDRDLLELYGQSLSLDYPHFRSDEVTTESRGRQAETGSAGESER